MKFSQLGYGRRFFVGEGDKVSDDVFTTIGDGTATDETFSLYRFPGEMPIVELPEGEQPKAPA
jgi:hypothetical protein